MRSTMEKNEAKDEVPAPARRGSRRGPVGKLFRVLVLGGVALAVAWASVPQGPTGVADEEPKDGGGAPGW